MPPRRSAAWATGTAMPFSPASKTTTPSPSSTRYTFIARVRPPRTSHTPSATRSGSAAASLSARGRARSVALERAVAVVVSVVAVAMAGTLSRRRATMARHVAEDDRGAPRRRAGAAAKGRPRRGAAGGRARGGDRGHPRGVAARSRRRDPGRSLRAAQRARVARRPVLRLARPGRLRSGTKADRDVQRGLPVEPGGRDAAGPGPRRHRPRGRLPGLAQRGAPGRAAAREGLLGAGPGARLGRAPGRTFILWAYSPTK